MNRNAKCVLPALGVIALGCSSGSSSGRAPPQDDTDADAGGAAGVPLDAASALAFAGSDSGVIVWLSDEPNTCTTDHARNSTNLVLAFVVGTATMGTFPVAQLTNDSPQPGRAVAVFFTLDGSCHYSSEDIATGGTATIDAAGFAGASDVVGSYDLVFPDRHLVGSFAAAWCAPAPPGATGCPP